MAITKNRGRQGVISAYVDITAAMIVAAGAYAAIDLPVGAQVVGGDIVVTEVFDSTTNTLSVGDASSAARYLGATTTKALGRTALVPTGFQTTATQPAVTVTAALTGAAPTTGAVRVRIDYIVNKRASFPQG